MVTIILVGSKDLTTCLFRGKANTIIADKRLLFLEHSKSKQKAHSTITLNVDCKSRDYKGQQQQQAAHEMEENNEESHL